LKLEGERIFSSRDGLNTIPNAKRRVGVWVEDDADVRRRKKKIMQKKKKEISQRAPERRQERRPRQSLPGNR